AVGHSTNGRGDMVYIHLREKSDVPGRAGRVSKMAKGLGREELQRLYTQLAPAIHRRARLLLGRDADAWDVVQEVFEKMLQMGERFRGEAQPMTWAWRV